MERIETLALSLLTSGAALCSTPFLCSSCLKICNNFSPVEESGGFFDERRESQIALYDNQIMIITGKITKASQSLVN